MSIDPRQLANLLAIARHGSFIRAAAAIGMSQPALSESIGQLERKLGVPVLERTRSGSRLNAFGEILIRHSETMSAILTQAEEEVRLRRLGVEGVLRIGATPSLVLKFLPTIMSRMIKDQGAAAISIVEGLDDELLPQLTTGALDVVFAPLSDVFPAPAHIVEEPLFDDPFAIAVGSHSPLARRKSISLGELQTASWVLPGPGSAYRRHIEALFRTAGVPWPDGCITTSSLSLTESLVAQCERVSFVSCLQTTVHNTWRVRAIPLKNGGKRTVGMKWRRSGMLSPLATRLKQLAHETSKTLNIRRPK
jgi:molybdate transport repressor ModE-like protein